jgi:DNA adenine methylase
MDISLRIDQSTKAHFKLARREARPFLKWVGGKQQLLDRFEVLFPPGFRRYGEPFVGSGAVFFHLWNTGRSPGQVFLFDNNEELINAYRVVRDTPEALIERLAVYKQRHSQSFYYEIRALDRQTDGLNPVERAARTIYLNKTCYNGLYRVNRAGQFNAPIGSYKNPSIFSPEALRRASQALQGTSIEVRDFRQLAAWAQPRDFVYFDPPYHPVSKTASFTGYTAGSFRDQDQRDLAAVFTQLAEQGCYCMLSNSYTPLILELYRQFRIEVVSARRAVNSDANGRGAVKEVVVLNY